MTMTRDEAMAHIRMALRTALNEAPEITEETDLIAGKVLDSLDAMVFVMELENASGVKFPEEDLEDAGFYRVPSLLNFLTAA